MPQAAQPAINASCATVEKEMAAYTTYLDAILKSSKARKAAAAALDAARAARDQAAHAVVVGLYTFETEEERKSLGFLLTWLCKQLPDLAEESIIPALQRLSERMDARRK